MPMNGNGLAERSVNGFQLGISGFRSGCAPGTFRTGMNKRHRTMRLNARQTVQPGEAFFSQSFTGCSRHLFDRGKHRLQVRGLIGKRFQRFRHKKHFIRISNDALPAEFTNAIDDFCGARAAVGQIATVKDQVGRGLPQIRKHRLKCGPVAVDVTYNCDPHRSWVLSGSQQVARDEQDVGRDARPAAA